MRHWRAEYCDEVLRVAELVDPDGPLGEMVEDRRDFLAASIQADPFIEAERWRFNTTLGLDAKVASRLSLNASVNVRFDNLPLPGVQKLDTTTMIGLGYAFF